MDTDISPQQPLQGADDLPSSGTLTLANEQEVVRKAGRQAISAFLDSHNCFSILRASGKVVVFDTRIPIQLAFYALVEHGELWWILCDYTLCSKLTRIPRYFDRCNVVTPPTCYMFQYLC